MFDFIGYLGLAAMCLILLRFFALDQTFCSLCSLGAKSLLLLGSFVPSGCRGRSFYIVQKSSMISRGYTDAEIRSCRVYWTPVSAVLTFPACCCMDSLFF